MTERSRVRRISELASYDREVIDRILDAGTVAHIGVVGPPDGAPDVAGDGLGQPFVIPTIYARVGDDVLVHGSVASRMLRAGASGAPMCLTVTLVDGLIVARSLFESSMRYRSVVVLGRAREVSDPVEKLAALLTLSDRLIPGRVDEARGPTDLELRRTMVFALPLQECSAKVSDGWPDDGEEDRALEIWAGVVPLRTIAGEPLGAPDLRPGIGVPPSVRRLVERPSR